MKTSESIKAIAPAFLAAQMDMAAATKDAINPAFGKTGSAYADLGSIIAAVKPALNKNGISYMQFPRLSEAGVEVETVLMHQSGEYVSDTLTIPLQRRDAQAVGSAISYGKRYGLQAICGLTSEDDDGNAASAAERPQAKQQQRQQQPRQQEQKPSPGDALSDPEDFRRALHKEMKLREFDDAAVKRAAAAILAGYGVAKMADLSLTQRHEVIDRVASGKADRYLNAEVEA